MAPLRCAAKLDPFLSLDCAPTPSTLAQSEERRGSNFAIWQPWMKEESEKGEGTMSAYRKRMKRRMELEAKGLKKFRKSGSFARRKSLTVLHDDGTVAMRDLG